MFLTVDRAAATSGCSVTCAPASSTACSSISGGGCRGSAYCRRNRGSLRTGKIGWTCSKYASTKASLTSRVGTLPTSRRRSSATEKGRTPGFGFQGRGGLLAGNGKWFVKFAGCSFPTNAARFPIDVPTYTTRVGSCPENSFHSDVVMPCSRKLDRLVLISGFLVCPGDRSGVGVRVGATSSGSIRSVDELPCLEIDWRAARCLADAGRPEMPLLLGIHSSPPRRQGVHGGLMDAESQRTLRRLQVRQAMFCRRRGSELTVE